MYLSWPAPRGRRPQGCARPPGARGGSRRPDGACQGRASAREARDASERPAQSNQRI